MQGVSAVQLIATDLIFKQNTTSVVNDPNTPGATEGKLLNWTASQLSAAGVDIDPATDPVFQIGGSVGLSVADVVFASATINVSRYADVTGVDDPDDAGTKVLKGDLLVVSITDATLFIGNGGSLNTDKTSADYGKVSLPASTDTTAVGFFVEEDGSLDLGIFTAGARA